jgi:predicted kinase
MSTIWTLPGPERFLDNVIRRRDERGVVAVLAPETITNLVDGLCEALRARDGAAPDRIRPSASGSDAPAHLIAARVPNARFGIRHVADLANLPEVWNRTFVVHDIPRQHWTRWRQFARQLATIQAETGLAPNIVLICPTGIGYGELKASFGAPGISVWRGVVSHLDAATQAHRLLGAAQEDPLSRCALATSIEVAGWNLSLLDRLLAEDVATQIDPFDFLCSIAGPPPESADLCWEAGLVDEWSEGPRVDSLALLASGHPEEIRKRIWRGHVQVMFPFLDEIRTALIRQFLEQISGVVLADPPWQARPDKDSPLRHSPWDLDLGEVFSLVRNRLGPKQRQLDHLVKKMRHRMAHLEPLTAEQVQNLADLWGDVNAPECVTGWDWPRCGQSLTLLIGPPGAGKSTWAGANALASTVVSSDAIREELNGPSSERVFREVRRRARQLLANGTDAVVDATNLGAHDRRYLTSMAPDWMAIRYVVIDRPVDDKLHTGTWRDDRPDLIRQKTRAFLDQLPAILNGDNDSRVTVTNLIAMGADADQTQIQPHRASSGAA